MGFNFAAALDEPFVAPMPALVPRDGEEDKPAPPAVRLADPVVPGTRLVSVGGTPVSSVAEARSAAVARWRCSRRSA